MSRSGCTVQAFADELVGWETFEGLQATPEIVGIDEVTEVPRKLSVTVVVIAPDRRLLEASGSRHPGTELTDAGGWHSATSRLEFCSAAGQRLIRHAGEIVEEVPGWCIHSPTAP